MRLIKPIINDDKLTLYRGDALRILRQPGVTFDHCIGDPPYEERMHAAKAKQRQVRTDGRAMPKALPFKSVDELRDRIIPLVKDRCGGWFLAFCTPEGIAPWRDAIEAGGMRYKRACFWDKTDAMPQMNGQGPGYGVEPFVTAWCGRGVSRWNGGGRRNIWQHPTNNPDREGSTPAEKPIGLMMTLIELFTKPGDVICDPYMGSGTTIIAALACGRRAIGIEKDRASFKLARARIDAAFKMGPDEARRHILRATGRVDANAGPLFAGGVDAQ